MVSIVHGLEADYGDRIQFSYLDIDDARNDDFKQALNYRVQPHIFLLDAEGNIVKQWLGRVSQEQFVAEFEKVLQ
jgi:thioredoxin-related protein